jgi:polyvinyl alcohol dehydrogenase (cytochrome)
MCAPGRAAAQALGALPALAPQYYTQHCASCHDAPDVSHAPSREGLRQKTSEAIYEALTTGRMAAQAAKMSDDQKKVLATFLSGRPPGSPTAGDATSMPNRCAPQAFGNPLDGPLWNGWGGIDGMNTRFQPQPGFTAAQIPKLTLKWAFGFPDASSAYSQPLVAGGRVYVASDATYVYSLDTKTGCVHWSYRALAGVRTAISLGRVAGNGPARYAVYFGDIQANVYALDAATGALIWTHKADEHPLARVTGAPALYQNRLFVPITSLEEAAGGQPNYPCCTFRGSVVAYDTSSGKQLWKTYTIATAPQPTKKTSTGTQLYGPAGAGVWSAPAIDAKRGVIYITTGNAYSAPADEGSEAVFALEMTSGKVRWRKQVTANDLWLVGCAPVARPGQSETCPDKQGPDSDFGSNASLTTLPNGKSVVVAQQKASVVWAFDPDNNGEILWQYRIGRGGPVQFGHATEGPIGYFAAPDANVMPDMGGLYAIGIASGERIWRAAPTCDPAVTKGCSRAHLGALTSVPGAVFASTADGLMRAYSAVDGKVIWEYNTAREYETVNKVTGKGGSLSGPGPSVAGGMVFINSGYSALGGNGPGNVLLAFGVD